LDILNEVEVGSEAAFGQFFSILNLIDISVFIKLREYTVMMPIVMKRRAQFLETCKHGARAKTDFIISVCHKIEGAACSIVGYTASRRIGGAVVRNKAKRRMRAIVHELQDSFVPGYSFVFIATSKTATCDFSFLKSDFIYCLRKSRSRADFGMERAHAVHR
jgi:ribonuclease P protein component